MMEALCTHALLGTKVDYLSPVLSALCKLNLSPLMNWWEICKLIIKSNDNYIVYYHKIADKPLVAKILV